MENIPVGPEKRHDDEGQKEEFNIQEQEKNIQEVFKLNPELLNIGSQEQYEEYVKTIFPDSIVKDIVWHGTTSLEHLKESSRFEFRQSKEYNYEHNAFFATSSFEDAKTGGTGKGEYSPIGLLLNIEDSKAGILKEGNIIKKNTDTFNYNSSDELQKELGLYSSQWEKLNWKITRNSETQLSIEKPDSIVKKIGIWKENQLVKDLSSNVGYIGDIKEKTVKELQEKNIEGVIIENAKDLGLQGQDDKKWYLVFSPEQIYILGSKSDMEKFKEFVLRNSETK